MKLIPAEVKSWDGQTMRIAIPGYTDGADQFPIAETCFPLADRPADTGYKILPGDPIWIVFNGGDMNSPIVMGFRNKNTGANKDTRFLEHLNFETKAEEQMKQSSQQHHIQAISLFQVESGQIVLKGPVKIEGTMEINGAMNAKGGMSIDGDVNLNGNLSASGSVVDGDGDGGA